MSVKSVSSMGSNAINQSGSISKKKGNKGAEGRRRSSATTTRSGSVIYRHTGGVNAPLGEQMEVYGMQKAEREQCSVQDTFWGIDRESNDRLLDRNLMVQEYNLSAEHESHCKMNSLHEEWEQQYQKQQHDDAYKAAVKEMHTRSEYMRTLFETHTSQDVMNFVWNENNHVTPKPGPSSAQNAFAIRGRQDDHTELSSAETFGRLLGGSTFELSLVDQEYPMHLHLDGIQQSRALASPQAQRGLGASLRNRTSAAGIAEAAMSSSRKPPGAKQTDNDTMGISMGGGVFVKTLENNSDGANSPSKTLMKLTTSKGKTILLPPPASRKHIEALDGHAKLGWDQEALLSAAFDLLDTSRTGRLTLDDMSHVAKNAHVKALLRFTVFGSLIKKRKWGSFKAIFSSSDAFIGFSEWLSAANAAALEISVPLNALRSEEEHSRISNATTQSDSDNNSWQSLMSSSTVLPIQKPGWFAQHARDHLGRLEREVGVRRNSQKGDVVWALHGGGVVWMQAVIEAVNDDGTFDLSYPFTQQAVNRLRESALTKRLVKGAVSNQTETIQNDFLLQTSRLSTLQACGKCFDLLFGEKSQAVSVITLIRQLYNLDSGIRALVESNFILNAIAPPLKAEVSKDISFGPTTGLDESKENNDVIGLFPPLSTALVEITSLQEEKIGKGEFMAFCRLVADRFVYQQK